jgi:hypothetical protein
MLQPALVRCQSRRPKGAVSRRYPQRRRPQGHLGPMSNHKEIWTVGVTYAADLSAVPASVEITRTSWASERTAEKEGPQAGNPGPRRDLV